MPDGAVMTTSWRTGQTAIPSHIGDIFADLDQLLATTTTPDEALHPAFCGITPRATGRAERRPSGTVDRLRQTGV
jgi:hypothetical protein